MTALVNALGFVQCSGRNCHCSRPIARLRGSVLEIIVRHDGEKHVTLVDLDTLAMEPPSSR